MMSHAARMLILGFATALAVAGTAWSFELPSRSDLVRLPSNIAGRGLRSFVGPAVGVLTAMGIAVLVLRRLYLRGSILVVVRRDASIKQDLLSLAVNHDGTRPLDSAVQRGRPGSGPRERSAAQPRADFGRHHGAAHVRPCSRPARTAAAATLRPRTRPAVSVRPAGPCLSRKGQDRPRPLRRLHPHRPARHPEPPALAELAPRIAKARVADYVQRAAGATPVGRCD